MDAITKTEHAGVDAIPADVSILKHINEHIQAKEDSGEAFAEEFSEEEGMSDHIESLGHISLTGKDFRTVAKKVTNCLHYHPGAHSG